MAFYLPLHLINNTSLVMKTTALRTQISKTYENQLFILIIMTTNDNQVIQTMIWRCTCQQSKSRVLILIGTKTLANSVIHCLMVFMLNLLEKSNHLQIAKRCRWLDWTSGETVPCNTVVGENAIQGMGSWRVWGPRGSRTTVHPHHTSFSSNICFP